MKIFFMFFHIEKCMGTSLRSTLFNYFTNKVFKKYNFKINSDINLLTEDEWNLIKESQYNVLLCHSSFNKPHITDFSKLCFSITCVREPVERFLSHYYYFMKPTNKLNFYEIDEKDIPYIILKCGGNLLTHRLSGESGSLEDAIHNLKYINCILIQSQINTDIINLNHMLDMYTKTMVNINLLSLNTNNESHPNILDMVKIKPFMNLFYNDFKLYNHILNMKIKDRFKFTTETSLSI